MPLIRISFCGSVGTSEMLIAFLRYLHAWRQYVMTVRELSSLNDCELADLGISRSDILHIARDQPQHSVDVDHPPAPTGRGE